MGLFSGYLLITDMDGTVLDDERNISNENIQAIKEFIAEGGSFTIATGRTVESARRYIDRYFKDIHIGAPVALYNGGKIYDFSKEETVWETYVSGHSKDVYKKIKKDHPELGLEIYSDEVTYIYNRCRFTDRYKNLHYKVEYDTDDSIFDKDWTKALIIGEKEDMDKFEDVARNHYDISNIVRSAANYLEVLPDGTSKGCQIEKICEITGFDLNKTIALGDEMNDLDMILKCKYGFAVANGNPHLLEKAKHKTVSNNESAIKAVIEYVREKIK